MRAIRPIHLLSVSLLAACSGLLGADFDDLEEQTPEGGRAGASGAMPSAGSGGANAGGDAGALSAGSAGISGSGGTIGNGGAGAGGEGATDAGGGADTFGGASGAGGSNGGVGGGGAGAGGGGCEAPPDPSTIAAGASVKINEIHGQGGGDDYVELYNLGPGTRDLSLHTIADGKGNSFTLPAGTLLGEGEFLVMILPDTLVNGDHGPFPCFMPCMSCFHESGWGISAGGEDVELRDGASRLLDEAMYPDEQGSNGLENGQNWARVPDGEGMFQAAAETPGLPNRVP